MVRHHRAARVQRETMSDNFSVHIQHPDWVHDAFRSLSNVMRLYAQGGIPASIDGWMVVTPTRRLLRGIYGSDLRAAGYLLAFALNSKRRMAWERFRARWWPRAEDDEDDGLPDDSLDGHVIGCALAYGGSCDCGLEDLETWARKTGGAE